MSDSSDNEDYWDTSFLKRVRSTRSHTKQRAEETHAVPVDQLPSMSDPATFVSRSDDEIMSPDEDADNVNGVDAPVIPFDIVPDTSPIQADPKSEAESSFVNDGAPCPSEGQAVSSPVSHKTTFRRTNQKTVRTTQRNGHPDRPHGSPNRSTLRPRRSLRSRRSPGWMTSGDFYLPHQ